ncbi:hypothetical protein [Streptomyces sp. OspMP-M43]|uniref:hypothetical protein n=1 Tax=Streptomyces sp. OspMP-M43 TaxID=1839781 RepID=UPI00081B9158|nr:hypothetical protein [Streptomyces sp. OspMP-M43]SCD35370.1 hypothetical protein GA0115261_100089 [Streptomyces sp. OspMP-M43]
MGMWIGNPGSLREIADGATSFDRSPDLGVTEFRSLSGAVTTWTPPVRPRRLRLSWEFMERADVEHLDRLARRVDAPGPIAVLDPLARNLLAGDQAAGLGAAAGKWAVTAPQIILYGGPYGAHVPNSVSVETIAASGHSDLVWRHPGFHGIPVVPGNTYTWWAPGLVAAGAVMVNSQVAWYNAAKSFMHTSTASRAGTPLVIAAPSGAAYVRPYVAFTATGLWDLGASVFAPGDISDALLGGERPVGDGCPTYSITGYTHAASAGNGRYRDVALELVEVVNSADG